jgi:hypothetical protein
MALGMLTRTASEHNILCLLRNVHKYMYRYTEWVQKYYVAEQTVRQ